MIELPALYLPFAANDRHAFVETLDQFADAGKPGDVLVVHAPTGAGKTHAVLSIAERRDGVLLTVPTNALAAEVEEAYRKRGAGDVARWNAASMVAEDARMTGKARHDLMREQARTAKLIVSNPDLLHLFTQNEHVKGWQKARLALERMKDLELLVFDEYHAYDERILAAVLLYVLKSRGARLPQRFVFMSATPDDGLPILLRELGLPHTLTEPATPSRDPPERGRMIKGPLRVDIRSDAITSSIPKVPPEGRTLFIFSTRVAEQQAAQRMREIMPRADVRGGFVEITGRDTRSSSGQASWDRASVLLATSKVDVGLNIADLDRVVMEPGWSEQQFWQRFGRAGRGRPADVILHFEGSSDEALAPLRAAKDHDGLTKAIRSVLSPEARHLDTVLRYIGAYAAAYRINSGASADSEVVAREHLPAEASRAFGLVSTILLSAETDEIREGRGGALAWRHNVEAGLRGLRGTELQAKARYDWYPDEVVTEPLAFILCRTEHSRETDGVYRISTLNERPKEATLRYEVADRPLRLQIRGAVRARDFRERIARGIEQTIADQCGRPLPPFWAALAGWLAIARPNEVAPVEMTPDDIFL